MNSPKTSSVIAALAALAAVVAALWFFNFGSLESQKSGPTLDFEQNPITSLDGQIESVALAADTTSPRWQELVEKYQPPDFSVREFNDLPVLGDTWADTFAKLSSIAESGGRSAQYGLFLSSYRCYRSPSSVEEYEEMKAALSAPFYDSAGTFVSQSPDNELRISGLEADWQYCLDSDQGVLAEYIVWLNRSAESGYLPALLKYGAGYPSDENLDYSDQHDLEIYQNRESALIESLEVAKDLGSIDAASKLVGMYLNHSVDKDPGAALSNLYASAWVQLKYQDNDSLFQYIERQGAMLPAYEYREALENGRNFLSSEECCIKIPEHR